MRDLRVSMPQKRNVNIDEKSNQIYNNCNCSAWNNSGACDFEYK